SERQCPCTRYMRPTFLTLLALLLPAAAHTQGGVPTFRVAAGQASYILAGRDPAQSGTTTIPTLIVPIQLSFDTKKVAGKPFVMDAAPDVRSIVRSPIFANFAFPGDKPTQYADALLRATIPGHPGWHTLLAEPEVNPVKIAVPAGFGYVLSSAKSGRSLAIVDVEWLQRELFRQVPNQGGRLVLAVTHNTAYYALGDATVCCSRGTHGVDSATSNSFVLASYIGAAPSVVTDADIQPITQHLANFVRPPRPAPLSPGGGGPPPPGTPAPPGPRPGERSGCGGPGVGSQSFLLDPTDTNPKNNTPASRPFTAKTGSVDFHL